MINITLYFKKEVPKWYSEWELMSESLGIVFV